MKGHRTDPVELPVLALVEAIEEAREVWNDVDDRQDFGCIHDLGPQGDSVKRDDGCDNGIEDAPLIREQLIPAAPVSVQRGPAKQLPWFALAVN